mmetsp:Transcript_38424/g.69259  ORF Transcript_38424/g.69259 Transcript_38424/m.69259 type:complete len:206 (+) Transcript_38424:239-856(+)|eukprot:CAMPEP_0201931182 /NCGR_PEP_ID=MMETSP0903-20130614/26798_1 /ASSEMBLY_ACC=CAM_ASM_000552 /TAXON_ID=420261 /ORGANISM="Thalassiosira antarctica, Strain CCMP982" /LENGTH=205 /DNA_ID=CAMNT_0048470439 /DNA_START=132 /DNA_END=749 /DNA_ORIENTATION=-
MSSAYQTSNVPKSAKSKGDPFGIPSTPSRCYSSPLPETSRPGGKSCYSPPPPPRHSARVVGGSELAADSVFLELNSGRSILNLDKPVDFSSICLPRKALYKGLEGENGNRRSVRPRIDSDFILASPSYPHFPSSPSSFSAGNINEEKEDDMPSIVSSIRLPLRLTRRARSPVAPRMTGRFLKQSFVPIQPGHDDDDDDEENQNEG